MGSSTSAWRRRLAFALGVGGLTLGLLLVAEGAARVVLRARSGAWPSTAVVTAYERQREVLELYRRHPFLNVGPRALGEVEVAGKRASLDSLGYRSPERPVRKPESTIRILCSGGSTTFDLLAASDETTWPWLLEEHLREQGHDVEVWNAGFPGWTTVESAISFLLRDVDLDPDVVVLFHGINDLQPAAHQPFDREYVDGHARRLRDSLGFGQAPPSWLERSVLLETLTTAVGAGAARQAPVSESASISSVSGEAVEVFERNLRTLVALAESRGARVVLATQWVRIRAAERERDLDYLWSWLSPLAAEEVAGQLERLNDVQRALAAELDLPLVDLARDLEVVDTDFVDPMHFSTAGSRKVAERMAEELQRVMAAPAPGEPPPPPVSSSARRERAGAPSDGG